MRTKQIIPKDICYLCGLKGADTNDHVPPKSLFETSNQRLTLPAHKDCNNDFSKDEEYFRDVFIQQAAAFQMPNIEKQIGKIHRSWSSTGKKRYESLVKTATKDVLFEQRINLSNVIKITPDFKILNRIAIKIARGVIYNDAAVVTSQDSYHHVYLPINKVIEVKQKDHEETFWKAMSSQYCNHTVFGQYYAVRRLYILSEIVENRQTVTCMMGLILGSGFFIMITSFFYDDIKNVSLPIVALKKQDQ